MASSFLKLGLNKTARVVSKLKDEVDNLPDNYRASAETAVNDLKKKGVKQEEIDAADLNLPESVDKSTLQKQEAGRADLHTIRKDSRYDYLVPAKVDDVVGVNNYAENIYTYEQMGEGTRYMSPHFPGVENYLMHTRTYEDVMDNKSSRVLVELQSDLHQGQRTGLDQAKVSELSKSFEVAKQTKDADATFNAALKLQTELSKGGFTGTVDDIISGDVKNITAGLPGVPDTPMSKSWAKKAIERELVTAINNGQDQLVIPISGAVQGLERSAGVQRWYEDTVANTAKKVAGSVNAETKEFTKDGIKYLGITPTDKNISFNLYGLAPVAAIGATHEMLYGDSGASKEQITKYYQSKGKSAEEIADIFKQADLVQKAVDKGVSKDQALAYIENKQLKPTGEASKRPVISEPLSEIDKVKIYRDRIRDKDKKLWANYAMAENRKRLIEEEASDAQTLVGLLESYVPAQVSNVIRFGGWLGNRDMEARTAQADEVARSKIIKMAADRGLQLEWNEDNGEYVTYLKGVDGPVPVSPGFFKQLHFDLGEIAFASLGAFYGARRGFSGVVAGESAGGALGSQLDHLDAAIALGEEYNETAAAYSALTSAEINAVFSTLGTAAYGLLKLGGTNLKKLKEHILGGNIDRAYKAVEENFYYTKEEAEELVNDFASVLKEPLPGTQAEQGLVATTISQPGLESVVRATGLQDLKVSQAVVKSISDRSKDLLKTVDEAAGENVGRMLREDLNNYVRDVQSAFNSTVAEVAQNPRNNSFAFDFDELGIMPAINDLRREILRRGDQATIERFGVHAQQIAAMADSHSLSDLLQLRSLVSELRGNRAIKDGRTFSAIRGILSEIDSVIEKGSKEVFLDGADNWYSSYIARRTDYSKMLKVRQNVLFKAVTKPGISEEDIAKQLVKHIDDVDDTFTNMLVKIPAAARSKVELKTLQQLAEKYTLKVEGGLSATNFPRLNKALNKLPMTTPESRKLKAAIGDLAKVFKNDTEIMHYAPGVSTPRESTYLATSLVSRSKYELVNKVWNFASSLKPGDSQDMAVLVRKLAKVIDKPMNSKSVNELIEAAGDDVNLNNEIRELQRILTAQQAKMQDPHLGKVRLFEGSNGMKLKPTNPGDNPVYTVHSRRIATYEDVVNVANAQGVNPSDTEILDSLLEDYGFEAVMQGSDRVRLLGE